MSIARNVMVIPARPQSRRGGQDDEAPKLRVAAYCRVSTDNEEQASSYEAQIEHYTGFIQGNPKWELAGVFADDGISGTNTKKRDEFNRMIKACMNGKIDMIVTKSISRFARNTLDCLKYIRQLKEQGISVFFEKENINTMDSKGEVLLTIMASLAQQESQSLSQNVKMGIQYRYQQGEVMVNHNRFLGYTKDEDKQLVIVPEEAKIVKRIFREYLEGSSLLQIGRGLEADEILTAAGNPIWRAESIRKILINEKYMGDALLQKTVTVDFLTKKRVENSRIAPQYYVENNHEAIIPRELFLMVQQEMARRANLTSGKDGKKRIYSGKHALSGIVFCEHCGDICRRITWNNRGCRSIVWRCATRLEKSSDCLARTVSEPDLHKAVVDAINQVFAEKDEFLEILKDNIEAVLDGEESDELIEVETHLDELQHELLRLATSGAEYDSVAEKIHKLQAEKEEVLNRQVESLGAKQRIEDLMGFLTRQSKEIEEYDEVLVRRLIENITVSDDVLVVELKSRLKVNVI